MFFLIAFLFIGGGSGVLAQIDHGSRYNPYNPYQYEAGGGQSGSQDRQVQKGRSYDPDNLANPSVTEPRRWYDNPDNYYEKYQQTNKEPKTLTSPYRDVKPYASEALTSPYEGIIPKRSEKPTTTQQLTPPAVK